MSKENQTSGVEFVLLGFQQLYNYKILYFTLFLTLYTLTMMGNVTIVTLVTASPNLKNPMFFFLGHLSATDIILTTNLVPNILWIILHEGMTMPLSACLTQLQIFGVSVDTQCLLLTAMSYDRYLAICDPLRYTSIMDVNRCLQLVALCWLLGFIISLITVILVSKLNFCGPNIIDHFYCDMVPLLRLSCSDTFNVRLENIVLGAPLTLVPAIIITITYVCIFMAILKIPSTSGRQKTFSTCSSHLAVVTTFFLTLITLYIIPSTGDSLTANNVLSLMYTVVTPLFNPIIYSLRNMEIRVAFKRYINLMNKGNM
ncbi:olfactory receptor 11L1-like [Pelodytes ibericus]